MKSAKNILIAMLAFAAITEAIFVHKESREIEILRTESVTAKTADAELHKLKQEQEALTRRVAAAEERAQHSETLLSAQNTKIANYETDLAAAEEKGRSEGAKSANKTAGVATSDESSKDEKTVKDLTRMMKGWVDLMKDPQAVKLMQAKTMAGVSSSYAGLFQILKLQPEQLDRLKGLLAEKQQSASEEALIGLEKGISPIDDPKGFAKLQETMQASLDADIKATLGEDGFKKYQAYQESQYFGRIVNQLEQMVSYSDTPLTPAQKQQLQELFVPGASNRVNKTMIQIAGGFLAPSQLHQLEVIAAAQNATTQLDKLRQKYSPSSAMTMEMK